MPSDIKLKVLYVENDSTLRGLIANLLRTFPEVVEVFDFASGEAAISFAKENLANVALLDVSLGNGFLDGFATGKELRRDNPNIGIVLFSQNSFGAISGLLDFNGLEAWSYVEKKADIKIEELIAELKKAALGISNPRVSQHKNFLSSKHGIGTKLLSQRQNLIMSLLTTGFEPKYIADRLEISTEVVRKDLSLAYAILVPTPQPGSDLRISAILRYQKLIANLGLDEA